MTRAPNLDDEAIARIVGLLDGWEGKLSWDTLIAAVERTMHRKYTRQALDRHARIKDAFTLRKENLRESKGSDDDRSLSPELRTAKQRIARLEAENARLENENGRFLEQFARWAYNAHTRGLDKDFLNRPLPPVNRDRTDISKVRGERS